MDKISISWNGRILESKTSLGFDCIHDKKKNKKIKNKKSNMSVEYFQRYGTLEEYAI